MCGIVGMALKATSGTTHSDARMFEEMLYMDALRGEDSTGCAAFYNNGELQVIKDTGPANWFRTTKEFETMMTRMISKGKAIIGHNRKKTIGKIDAKTAHPFIIDDRFAFVHNGTLINHEKLHKTEVDSEALGIHLTECEGDKEKLEEALSHVNGAYACAWIDQEKEKLYLLRNKDRPMVLATTSIGYIFCSEYGFLLAAAARNRLKLDEVEVLDEDTLYEFDLGGNTYGCNMKKEKLTIKKSLPPVSISQVTGGSKEKGGAAGNEQVTFPGTLSKGTFKKFKKRAIGRSISFWMDDFVESNSASDCRDWIVWGESTTIEVNHVVQGVVRDRSDSEIKNYYKDKFMIGVVSDVAYDEENRNITINVGQILPVIGSTKYH